MDYYYYRCKIQQQKFMNRGEIKSIKNEGLFWS